MDTRKLLIVYFSRSGTTRAVARLLAQKLQCDSEEIRPRTSYFGWLGYQRALVHSTFRKQPPIELLRVNPGDYDLILVGGPVWGASIPAPIRSFLNLYKSQLKNVAFFLTQGGEMGRGRFFEQMQEASQRKPLALLAVKEEEVRLGRVNRKISVFLAKIKQPQPEEFYL